MLPSHPFFCPACVNPQCAPLHSRFPSLSTSPVTSLSHRPCLACSSSALLPLALCLSVPSLHPHCRRRIAHRSSSRSSSRSRCSPLRIARINIASSSSQLSRSHECLVPQQWRSPRYCPCPSWSAMQRRLLAILAAAAVACTLNNRIIHNNGTTSDIIIRRLRRRPFDCCVLILLTKMQG